MTSSSSFELTFTQDGATRSAIRFSIASAPLESAFPGSVRTDRDVQLQVVARDYRHRVRVLLAGELVAVVSPARESQTVSVRRQLADTAGHAVLYLEAEAGEAEDEWECLLTGWLAVEAPPHVESVHHAIVADLERIHAGLALDIVGATTRREGVHDPRLFDPAREQARLEEHLARLDEAIRRIAIQPSSELVRRRRVSHLRSGDRVDRRMLLALVRSRRSEIENGQLVQIGATPVARVELTHDIAEHRHLRAGLEALQRDCVRLQAHSRHAAELYECEADRWDIRSGSEASVYEQRFKPRVQKLHAFEKSGRRLAARYRALIRRNPFIRDAGRPRSPLAPTPIFVGRPAYRDVYDALRNAHADDVIVDGQHLGVLLNGLDTLYEYWVYIAVVHTLSERFGAPQGEFQLVDAVYRPSLESGQSMTWRVGSSRIQVHYEPAIPPLGPREGDIPGWRASLVRAPLRPDVIVSVAPAGRQPVALAIDAKNTTSFTRDRLFKISDYRTLVLTQENYQPIRMLFLAHRTTDQTFCSIPQFLEGVTPPPDASLSGALYLVPGATDGLRALIGQFWRFARR